MVLNKNSKRLGIFVFYDKDSYVDDYVVYMLDDFIKSVDDLIIVSNVYLPFSEKQKFKKYTDKIEVRSNIGLDAGAFKYIYDKYKDYFLKFDELVLMNDTFYGPFTSFSSIFDEMNKRNLDFWGLTANYDSKDGYGFMPDKIIHSHIQTFFIAFRKNVLKSKAFNDYWKKYNCRKMNSFIDVVTKHELSFTNYLEKKGFKWDTYVDLSHYKSKHINNNYNIYAYSSYTLLKDYNCPFIKRKNFVFDKKDASYINDGMDAIKSLDWIKNNLSYDYKMIINNLRRNYDCVDIYQSLNMNYIVEEKKQKNAEVLVVLFVNDIYAYNVGKSYTDQINNASIMYLTSNKKMANNDIKYIDDYYKYIYRNRLEFEKKYDYVCFLDLNCSGDNFQGLYDSQLYRLLDNSIYNSNYINGVIELFNDEIGALYLPEQLNYGNFKYDLSLNKITNGRYRSKFSKTKHLLKAVNGIWIRSNILKNIAALNCNFSEFVYFSEYLLKNDNYLLGKIYNKEYVVNDVILYEKKKIINIIQSNGNVRNVSLLRKYARIIIPFAIRKKVMDTVRNIRKY